MSNKYTQGLDQRYIQNFQGKDDDGNVKGSFGSADRSRYDAYAKATQGLDKDLAFKALEGGMTFGDSDRARYDKLVRDRDSAAKAKAQASAKAKAQAHKNNTTNNVNSSTNKPAKTPKQKAPSNTLADGSQRQDITQDNDINTNINGDGNLVNNNQDNSIRQYGGNTKTFNYNGNANGNPYESTPVSAGTMAGFFHDEDSPGSSAAFVDRYSTMNRDNQKRYKNVGIAQTSIHNAKRNEAINFGNLDKRIQDRSKATRARSTSMAGEIFGDMFNFTPQDFKAPEAPDPIKKPSFM
jgi:hypothetical protein